MDHTITKLAGDHLLKAIASAKRDVFLASPYLTMNLATRLANRVSSKVKWRFLTCLSPVATANGYLPIEGLQRLLDVGVQIGHHPRLHAKAYIVDDDFALVGSANLTGTGLGTHTTSNAELSVLLQGEAIEETRRILASWWTGDLVDPHRLARLATEAANLPKAAKYVPTNGRESAPTARDVEQLLADARDPGRALWVKAQHHDPHLDGWRGAGWFSSSKRGKPGFRQGDLVLIYSKDAHGCYAVVEITDEPTFDPDYVAARSEVPDAGERWPWVNTTMPRLVPTELQIVTYQEIGFSPQALQSGHKRLTLSEFAAAVRTLAERTVEPL
ncbi:phospholipase D-like domain-containing protein [Nocardia asteroides]|uniref:phospholipase D-like domain-containing protein n=1 Tax=Nocardia asteroides TaxID=1824 RepID=UPI0037AEEBCE